MNEQRKKKLRKFVRPHHENYIGGITFLIIGIGYAVGAAIEGQIKNVFWGLLFGLGLGGLILYSGIKDTLNYRRKIKEIEDNNALEILLNDFETGGKAFKDSLILGKCFLIGKRMGTIISYNEITRIYQYIEKTNGVESKRTIKIETVGNRKFDLCMLKLRGKSDDEFKQVIEYILSMNSNIIFGYKG